MSIDFDSGALQTQQEEEEYDREDYAREQELQQLLTDLPDDMLEDSTDFSSPELNCSVCSVNDQSAEHLWEEERNWNNHPGITEQENFKDDFRQNQYHEQYLYQRNEQGENHSHQLNGEPHVNGWSEPHNGGEHEHICGNERYSYASTEGGGTSGKEYAAGDGYNGAHHYRQASDYCLPELYPSCTNGKWQEMNSNQGKTAGYLNEQKEHFQYFIAPEHATSRDLESYKVKYNPCQPDTQHKNHINHEETKRLDQRFEELQSEFLETSENSLENQQLAQLQVLYKARGRQLEELRQKLEESIRENRCLHHQRALVEDEKKGFALSLQESKKLLQNGKETELQFQGQIKVLETKVLTLTTSEEEALKKMKIAEAAMESMQQQLMDLCHSESLTRAREQHETAITALRQKYEEKILALQQKIDEMSSALAEQKEVRHCLEEHIKQLERQEEEAKLEKADLINRLTKSLEESQKQCSDLLQTGTVQEINQLRFQLQQTQSAKNISDGMIKSLQEELTELKEQISLYESAAKFGIFVSDPSGETEIQMSESYMELGIKRVNWKTSKSHSRVQYGASDENLSQDDLILDLKAELQRLLNSIKIKRSQVIQFQNDLKESQRQISELKKKLETAEKLARDHEVRASSLQKQLDQSYPSSFATDKDIQEKMDMLKKENQTLQQEIENNRQQIQQLMANEEKLKVLNQELCNEMRQMVQDFDQDKQADNERYERIYQHHHEDVKSCLRKELLEKHTIEKEHLTHIYEEQLSHLRAKLEELNQKMSEVQECYITICREKETLEETLKEKLEQELKSKEDQLKKQLYEEKEESLNKLKAELDEKHKIAMITAKDQWMKEKAADIKQQVETRVALAQMQWQSEQEKIKEQAKEAEKNWQLQLDKTMEEMKRKHLVDTEDCGCQTEQSSAISLQELEAQLESQKQSTEEKNECLKEALEKLEVELERKHQESVAKQVETALTKAHARWVQELTSLAEYKFNLRAEKEKWDKEHEQDVAKQVSIILNVAEDKWLKKHLKELEEFGANTKNEELQEKVTSLERELKLRKEQHAALLKAELAKARAEWSKEKQEEINRIHELNERDYRTFLDNHRNKISEALAAAKEDFERQKNDLLAHKVAEIRKLLDEKQKEWTVHETKKLQLERQQCQNETVAEIKLLLREIQDQLPKQFNSESPWNEKLCSTPKQSPRVFNDEMSACLHKAFKDMVYKIVEAAKQEWNEKSEEKLVCAIKEAELRHEQNMKAREEQLKRLAQLAHGRQEVELQKKLNQNSALKVEDQSSKQTSSDPEEKPCSEHCFEQHEKLKRKLEKACKQLQFIVKDHKVKVQQLKEKHEIATQAIKEKGELKRKLQEIKATCNTAVKRSQEGKNSSENCRLCSGEGLKEMRAQYMMAVDKIREDMLCYIKESKERASEMLRTEVLRERQETARKMRKYYLICLQQLLIDNGKNEGAERKIMNAASKLATMAKALETPLPTRICNKDNGTTGHEHSTIPVEKEKIGLARACKETKFFGKTEEIKDDKPPNVNIKKNLPHSLSQQIEAVTVHENKTTPWKKMEFQHRTNEALQYCKNIDGSLSEDTASLFHCDKDKTTINCYLLKGMQKEVLMNATDTHIQNSKMPQSRSSFGKLHTRSCNEDISDLTSAHVACQGQGQGQDQDQVPVLKRLAYSKSKEDGGAKSETGYSFDIKEMPVRDEGASGDWNSSQDVKLDNNLVPSSYPMYKTIPMRNHAIQVPPSSTSVASEVCCLPDAEENTYVLKQSMFPLKHINDQGGASKKSVIYKELLCKSSRSKSQTHITLSSAENSNFDLVTVNDMLVSGAEIVNKSYCKKSITGTKIAQQDSGFDSPLPNFS
ncbi:centrosomal protein of 152 kDa [Latimeria chalumnae]|uniref:centrosomal protein of 152 kDa n=1 Tax=Latimeria chalumnae TaxID=7897 RepID=UPI0003C1974E|nr:PREDICTED: centrosomal protein of 152 kDa [Latimeria chalumnae]|eukprot:XP_005998367.1 PREDICTED: centrosomal protein of 152 kDa [Latimeria chalumnae]